MPTTTKTKTKPATKTKPPPPPTNGQTGGAMKLREARAYLGGLSKPTLYRLVADGKLKPCRGVRHVLFPVRELDRFLSA
jgi:excisionase family DNA binding protein